MENYIDSIVQSFVPKEGELSPSTKLLIKDLEAVKTEKNKEAVNKIINNAKTELYHDFLTTIPCPMMRLVNDLTEAKLDFLASKAEEGEYDA